VIKQLAAHGGNDCPTEQQRTCNTHVCPTPNPTTAPTPAPTPAPVTTPLIHITGGDVITLQADPSKEYLDAGAVCNDDIDGELAVAVTGDVNMGAVGLYSITYNCANHRGYPARPAVRSVVVHDILCPQCHILGGKEVKIEASFPYADAGAYFTDPIDGKIVNVIKSGTVDTNKVGDYVLTYRAQDSTGNWNDGNKCTQLSICQRTVTVIDTLRPVIALKYKNTIIHTSSADDTAVHDASLKNPAAKHTFFMAETASRGAMQSFGCVVIGAVGVFVALLARRPSPTRVVDTIEV
jgi:hypothetical protein